LLCTPPFKASPGGINTQIFNARLATILWQNFSQARIKRDVNLLA
jgi:hypothetical protein